jgi:predicted exporter
MSKPIFPLTEQVIVHPNLQRGQTTGLTQLPLLWLVFHGGLFLALALSLFVGPLRINTSLLDRIPVSGALKSAAFADAILGERNGRQIVILSAHEDFFAARKGAEALYTALLDTGDNHKSLTLWIAKDSYTVMSNSGGDFESLILWVDESFMDRFGQYLHDHRFMLIDKETRALLDNGVASALAANALASVFSPFTLVPLDNLADDPFLLVNRSMQHILGSSLLSSGNMSPHNDVLAAQYEDTWYVMLRGNLAPQGLSLTNRKSTVKKIYDAGAQIAGANPGLRFFYSGVPFHSYESSSNAQREISLISTISLLAILAIFLYAFRSPVPVLAALSAIVLSLITAFMSTMLFFREVHVLSFVFGTTLIGTCTDYSIHFIIHRGKYSSTGISDQIPLFTLKPDAGAIKTRARVLRGLALCLISTAICFFSFLFAPFSILKQFAVFSISGLLSSFLTVMCVFPLIRTSKRTISFSVFRLLQKIQPGIVKRICIIILAVSFSLFIILIFINRNNVRVENKLSDLYKMSGTLLESERINAQVLNYGSSGWYFIVSGVDAEEVLQNEENLCAALDTEIARGNLGSYMAVSSFSPSQKTQRSSFEAAKKLLPLAQEQFTALGFPPGAVEDYHVEFASAENYLSPTDGDFPPELSANLWIGKAGDAWYSCVMPLHAAGEDAFRKIAAERENIFFVNKVNDTQRELDHLTRTMLFLFLIAFAVIIIMIRRFYSWRQTVRIFAVPVFVFLAVLAVLSCLNIPLGFFSIVGIILVFGLGLDFIFYNCEAENRRENKEHTALAILLTFVTTALSFGALALSSFAPIHIFGITVFSGLCAAYIFSTLLSVNTASENQRISGSPSEEEIR